MMSDEFIEYEHSVQNERIRLFCFHYAGGNASFYSDWYKVILAYILSSCPAEENAGGLKCTPLLKKHQK